MVYSWHILSGGIAMELTDSLKALFIETAKSLKGHARRLFMARTVKELGAGGQRRAERELGWGRMTIRKGTYDLESGFTPRAASPEQLQPCRLPVPSHPSCPCAAVRAG